MPNTGASSSCHRAIGSDVSAVGGLPFANAICGGIAIDDLPPHELALSDVVQLSASARLRLAELSSAEEASHAARTGFGLARSGQEPLVGASDAALDPEAFAASAATREKVSDAMLAGFKSSLEELMSKLEASRS